ncbi:MAG: alpha/beta hydrolase family protein, partial [bacterium]
MTTCLGSPASARLVWACVLLLPGLYGCGDAPVGPEDGDVVAGVDLDVLFAPPDAGERAAVEADWAGRTPRAEGVTVEAEAELSLSGETMLGQVVSHVVDGHRHYGLILTPLPSPPDPLPVLVYAHGGDDGTSMAEVLLVTGALGLGSEDYVLVAPAYRSESVRLGDRRWISEGPASPWDGDVDDALSLVEVALATAPMADASRIGVLGLSRGGTVGLLMAIRDPRIRAVVSFFAPTDFFGPFVRDLVRSVLLGTENRALSGLEPLAEGVIRPLQQGRLGMGEARQELLRRSPAWFASRLPAVQIHHGTADEVVPEEEAERLR